MGRSKRTSNRSKARSKSKARKASRSKTPRAAKASGRRGQVRAKKTRELSTSQTNIEESQDKFEQANDQAYYIKIFPRVLAEFIERQPVYKPDTPYMPGFIKVGEATEEGQDNVAAVAVPSDFEHIFHYSDIEARGNTSP